MVGGGWVLFMGGIGHGQLWLPMVDCGVWEVSDG